MIRADSLGFKGNRNYTPETISPATVPTESFDRIMSVLTHPRCMNCHPSDNIPMQGLDGHMHYFSISGGEDGEGFASLKCFSCHQDKNNPNSGVPGAPHWKLAPPSMGWQGLSKSEIARSLLDPERNGNRDREELIRHLTEDSLVLWAWNPGTTATGKLRETPPVSFEAFRKAVHQWFDNGNPIPDN